MADKLRELVKTSELRSDYLKSQSQSGYIPLYLRYDDRADTLMILFVPPETETVVHYVDQFVALLFKPATLDIVGLQVEDFEHQFLSKYAGVEKAWKLSDSDTKVGDDVGDLLLIVEKRKSQVAHEVLEATEPVLGQRARDFKDLLQPV